MLCPMRFALIAAKKCAAGQDRSAEKGLFPYESPLGLLFRLLIKQDGIFLFEDHILSDNTFLYVVN